MMKLFEGLSGYEAVLLVLGSLLFVVLVGMMVFFAVKERPVKPLLTFFLLPILMIGFPGIEKVKFGDSVEVVTKSLDTLQEDPKDQEARSALAKEVASLEGRVLTGRTQQLVDRAKALLRKPVEPADTPTTTVTPVKPLTIKPLPGTVKILKPVPQQTEQP